MTCLKRSARHAVPVAGVIRAALAGMTVLAVAACSGGALAQNTPISSGQSFVGASYSSTYFAPGARPAAPAVTGTLLTGQRFSLSSDRGSVVVLNFWASWCSPCRAEAPSLATLASQFRRDQVRFVGVDSKDSPSAAEAFQRTYGMSYPSLNDPDDEIALAFHGTVPPPAIPTTMLIDRTGHIAAMIVGSVSYAGLKALIIKVLGGRS